MTFRELKDLTLGHLKRFPDDTDIPADKLAGAINRARRSVWNEAGGPHPETHTLDLVAGRGVYGLPGPIAAASVRDTVAGPLRQLERVSPSTLLVRYPRYPDTNGLAGVPAIYVVAPIGNAAAQESLVYRALHASTSDVVAALPQITLFPTPAASLTGGLVVQAAAYAAPLVDDAQVSPLTQSADEAACWMAAAGELSAFISEEDANGSHRAFLAVQLTQAKDRLRDDVWDLLGDPEIYPQDHFGSVAWNAPTIADLTYSSAAAPGAPIPEPTPVTPAARRSSTYSSVLSENGSTAAVRIDTSSQPVVTGSAILAFSGERLFIEPALVTVGAGGLYVDVAPPPSADGGTPKWYGERVYVFYDTEVSG